MARKKLENTGTGINTRMIYEDEQPTISTSSTTDDPYLRMEVTGWYEINSHNFKAGPLINLPGAASPPANPEDGDVYYNTSDNIVYIYYSGSWHSIVSSSQGSFLLRSNNLSDVESASASRTNLGLGDIAVKNVDDVIKQTINSGNTTTAPSENAVYNALAGKASATQPYCRLKLTSNSSANGWTTISWQASEFLSPTSMWSTSNPTKIYIPVKGIYIMVASTWLSSTSPTYTYVAIQVNVNNNGYLMSVNTSDYTYAEFRKQVVHVYPLEASDYLTILVYAGGGISRTIYAEGTRVEVMRLGSLIP